MRDSKVSYNSQLYSEQQTVYTLRVKRGHLSKVLLSSGCIQLQGQATHGKNMVFYKATILNLWVKTLCGSNDHFHSGCLRPLENTDIYTTIHNSSKTSYEVAMKVILWLGHNIKNRVKGLQH